MLLESGLELIGTHWKEAALYLALTLPKTDPNRQKLEGVIPKWKKEGKATCVPPGITTGKVRCRRSKRTGTSLSFTPPPESPPRRRKDS